MENGGKFRIDIFDKYTEIYTKVLDLQIRNVKKEDYGNYTCIASNKLGEDKETMLLYGMCINVIGVGVLIAYMIKTSF